MELLYQLSSLNLRELPAPSFNRIALIVINFVAISLLFVVFRSNRFRDIKSRIFGFMVLFMFTWVNFAYLARVFGLYPNISLLFLRIAWVATPPLFYSAYLISIYVIKKDQNHRLISKALFVITVLLSASVAFTDWVIVGTKFSQSILDIVYGLGFFPFLFFIFVIMCFTIFPLVGMKLTRSARAFLAGVMIFYVANMVFNIGLPVLFGVTYLYFLGDYSMIFLLGLTTYAIVRHELFDIKVVATEILTFIMWIILFTKLFVNVTVEEAVVDLIVFGLMVFFGILLIQSVRREVKQRQLLEELTKKLKELDAQKDEFLNVAAHELRAPMTAIKGYLSMVMDGDGRKVPDKANEFLGEAAEGNDRLIRLVNNMLNISRIEEGRLTYDMGEVNLAEIVEDTYNTYRHEAEAKNIDLRTKIYDRVVDRVYVDRDRIHEVLSNLVSNAVKYTDKGSVVMKLYNPSGGVVRFEVTDSGPGISDEDKGKMFQRFQRAQSSAGKKLGSGLGLYVSKLLVEKFGGRIGFESSLGKGSTFWFELPVRGS